MGTLIVYATKYGCTKEYAEMLAGKLNSGAELFNCKDKKINNLNKYDAIIIGSPVYAGNVKQEIKDFCADNIDVLKTKKIGLFICGWQKDESDLTQINNCYPKELTSSAISKEYFGGFLNYDKFNFFERLALKIITKTSSNKKKLCEANIKKMADCFNKR